MSHRRPRLLAGLLALLALPASACGNGGGGGGGGTPPGEQPADGPAPGESLDGTLNVFAAASLTDAFTDVGEAFTGDHPGVEVTFSFAGSSTLARQINEGAPADVFVSADEANMARVVDAGSAAGPRVIARNRLAILVEEGNPKGIRGLAGLAGPGVVFVMCAPEAPCGKLGALALAKAGVAAEPASLEENVRAVVARVTLGEADAGIVYETDVRSASGDADGVDVDVGIADDPELGAVYQIAVTKQAGNPGAARAWIDFVLSGEGRRILADHGFLAP